jgi:DNA-binding SARP family transcriptional activator/tetratricopeptide (TPR) repeat protein
MVVRPDADRITFRLLGQVQAWAGVHELDLGPPQRRLVFAALAVDARHLVPMDVLISRVWDEPPRGASQSLRVHIARLRRMLSEPGAPRLVHRPGGYILDVDPESIDLHRFRRLTAERIGDRLAALRSALALWQGEPLTGLPGGWAERTRARWSAQRLDATVAWAHAELAAAGSAAVINAVPEMMDRYPFAEPLAAVLMRALHLAGRTPEALACFAATRRRLADELGVDPGRELLRVHEAILRGEIDLGDATPATVPAVVPAQLPLDVPGFSGRDEELERLDAIAASAAEPAVVVAVLSGMAGVGKTALALHWAHRVAGEFPDGQLYANLHGFHPAATAVEPAEAVHGFLDALGVSPRRMPATLAAQLGLYRSLLAGKRVLIMLDNARDADQVRPLLPGHSGCLVLVTSRNQMPGLTATEGAHQVVVDPLTDVQSRELLIRRLGTSRVTAEPATTDRIVHHCGRLPLALAIVAGHAALHPHFPLTVIEQDLRDSHHRLHALGALAAGDRETEIRAVFSCSYEALSPGAARLFRLIGLHPGPDVALPAAASLAGVAPEQAQAQLTELTHTSLITQVRPGRYQQHDLLRAYADERSHTHDSADERGAAVHRAIDHYLHTASRAAERIGPVGAAYAPFTLAPPRAGVTIVDVPDRPGAMDWMTTERATLCAAPAWAAANALATQAWQLAVALENFLRWRGHWDDLLHTQATALKAATWAASRRGQALTRSALSRVYARLHRFREAYLQLLHADELYQAIDAHTGQAHTQLDLAYVLAHLHQNERALSHAARGLALFEAAGDEPGHARALNMTGFIRSLIGEHDRAAANCRQALELFQQAGDVAGQASAWTNLAQNEHARGVFTSATDCYRRAINRFQWLGDRYGEALALNALGDTQHAAGDLHAAALAWQESQQILQELDHPDTTRSVLCGPDVDGNRPA